MKSITGKRGGSLLRGWAVLYSKETAPKTGKTPETGFFDTHRRWEPALEGW